MKIYRYARKLKYATVNHYLHLIVRGLHIITKHSFNPIGIVDDNSKSIEDEIFILLLSLRYIYAHLIKMDSRWRPVFAGYFPATFLQSIRTWFSRSRDVFGYCFIYPKCFRVSSTITRKIAQSCLCYLNILCNRS